MFKLEIQAFGRPTVLCLPDYLEYELEKPNFEPEKLYFGLEKLEF